MDLLVLIAAFVIILIGGAGTVFGPVIGAFILETISELVWSRFLNLHLGILDKLGRPTPFYGKNVHDTCPYLPKFDAGQMCATFTQKDGCRYDLGCKGPNTNSDCPTRKWNNGINWCVENAVCIGCVEPGFPDGMSPFYVAG